MSSASSTGGQEPAREPKPADGSQTAPKKAVQPAPKMLGKYQLRKKIGAGGMGAVYLAVDTQLKRTVALKMLPREKAKNATLVKRFKAEAHAAAQLKHDNIVTIYEAGEAGGYLFIALEYVEGTDVFKLIATRGAVPVKRSIAIVKQVARALQHSHSKNIVHRDIKPSNLLIQRDGTVKLTDMGLARSVDEETETGITRAGMTVGTVDYMSPEQARDSKQADIRSDIYSLGCTWYHMLTGVPPFAEGSVTNKLYNHASKSRPDPRDLNEAIPDGIVETMHKMMAKKPADRYQTPDELLTDLENAGLLTKTSAELLLETISDTTDAETGTDPSAAGADNKSRVASSVAGKLTIPDSPGGDREWMKYALGLGGVAALAVLVIWLSQQFASVFDGGGGVAVNRNADDAFDDDGGGGGGGTSDGTPSTDTATNGGASDESVGDDTGGPRNPNDGDGPKTNPRPTVPTPIPRTPRNVPTIQPATKPAEREKITIGREGEKEYLPAWIADFPTPEDPAGAGKNEKVTTLSVGRVQEQVSKHGSINAAIEQLPANGGVIQLIGTGPFDLAPLRIADGRKIVIAGAPDVRSVVSLQPDIDNPDRPVVAVVDGSLTLLNIQIVAVAKQFRDEGTVTLFDVQASDFAVRNCSCTLLGERSGTTVAFRSSASTNPKLAAETTRMLLDRSFVRGNRLSAVAIEGAACDFIASNCLFVSGAAPIIQVSGSSPPVPKDDRTRRDANKEKPIARVLKLISCTGVATKTAFELAPGSGNNLPPTVILTLNSLFASSQGEGKRYFASLGNWPDRENRGAGESSFVNLRWLVRSTVCLGWTAFLHRDGDPPLLLTSISQWQHAWNELVQGSRFVNSRPWPSAPLKDLAKADPRQFDPGSSGVNSIVATDGGQPGCQTAAFVVPTPELMERVEALAERPIVRSGIFQNSKPVQIVQIDLNKGEDLGRVISRKEWRSGTLFVAFGSGARKTSPIQVRGRAFRIEFRQTGGLPLQITPRAVNPKTVAREGLLADAMISISGGGRLEIANGRFRIPNSTSVPNPKWLLVARDGSFLFDHCLVQGPSVGNTRNEGLIRWESTGNVAGESRRAGRYDNSGEIRNSFFKGTGTLMRVDIAGRALIVHNSVLVTTDNLFDLNIRGTGSIIHGTVQIDQSTLSAKKLFFRIAASPRRKPPALPLQLFVEQTIFAPPVGAGAASKTGPTLLSYSEPAARTERQLSWWGLANGYTNRLQKYLDGPAEVAGAAAQFETGWVGAWAKAACLRPLSGSGAVVLGKPLPMVTRLESGDFALHSSSKAIAWAADGKSIGADMMTLKQAGPRNRTGTKKPLDGGKKPLRKPKF